MRWDKLGLVFKIADASVPWMRSHAQLPVPDHVSGDVYRVYFATRSAEQVSSVGWVSLELRDRVRLLEVGTSPVLEPGGIGTFDEHGVFPSCVISEAGRKRMYYIGWNRGHREPLFYAAIGLATSTDGGRTWSKHSPAPIMARSQHDPCLVTSPHVAWHGGQFRMTYVSGVRWAEVRGKLQSYYHIKYAESADGVEWTRRGWVAIDFASEAESNIARSWVIPGTSGLHMWFSYVRDGMPYRMGYARSEDYLNWRRDDHSAGIDVSGSGWDSEMICYPSVVVHSGRAYLFYNGNTYGREGFGVAVSEAGLQ